MNKYKAVTGRGSQDCLLLECGSREGFSDKLNLLFLFTVKEELSMLPLLQQQSYKQLHWVQYKDYHNEVRCNILNQIEKHQHTFFKGKPIEQSNVECTLPLAGSTMLLSLIEGLLDTPKGKQNRSYAVSDSVSSEGYSIIILL